MAADAYDALLDRARRLGVVRDATGVLHWDQQVTMPEGGTAARARQLSALSTVLHEGLVSSTSTPGCDCGSIAGGRRPAAAPGYFHPRSGVV